MSTLPEQAVGEAADPSAGQAGDDLAARLIADSAERLFATRVDKALRQQAEAGEFPAALWQAVCEAGLPLLLAAESAGGFGQTWDTAFAVLRGIGYWQVPLPLAETLVAAQLATLAGLPLPDPAAGPLTLLEQGRGNTLRLDDGGATLSGTAHRVPWARHAQAALVALADGRLAWLDLADAPGLRLQPQADLAGLPADTLRLDCAPLRAAAPCPLPLAEPVWTLGAVAGSAVLAGVLESALEQAVRYAGERVQFGKPIGKYQAIQQQLALMAGDVAAARMAARVACADAPAGAGDACRATRFSAAVAKARAGEAATRGAAIAHQVHGAIGFTHEHALHFATRRLWAGREAFGSDADWAAELGRAAIAARAGGFWTGLTDKRFAPAAA